jgi:hypothetical protein
MHPLRITFNALWILWLAHISAMIMAMIYLYGPFFLLFVPIQITRDGNHLAASSHGGLTVPLGPTLLYPA